MPTEKFRIESLRQILLFTKCGNCGNWTFCWVKTISVEVWRYLKALLYWLSTGKRYVTLCRRCELCRRIFNNRASNRIRQGKEDQIDENTMKTDFYNLIFSNEFRINLDGPDAWPYGWVLHNYHQQACIMRGQSGGSVMFLI